MKRAEEKSSKASSAGFTLRQPTPADLRGRQSVRATFRLSPEAIGAVTALSVHLGIKQKSLFDHLLEDRRSVEALARQARRHPGRELSRVQKTYVISRKTLACLEKVARDFQTPRDVLVESAIRRLLPLIEQERERHEKRKQIYVELEEYVRQGARLLQRVREKLGEEDPVYETLEAAMAYVAGGKEDIAKLIEKGRLIEEFGEGPRKGD